MQNEYADFLTFGEDYLGPVRDWPLSGAEATWIDVWLFGIVVDNDTSQPINLGSYWNPDGKLNVKPAYYVPDDYDTEIPTVSVDAPPTVDAAWDSKGVAA